MRQQQFNEMLKAALTDKEIKQQIRKLLEEKDEEPQASFEEQLRKVEELTERVEKEMLERAKIMQEMEQRNEQQKLEEEQLQELKKQLQKEQLEKSQLHQQVKAAQESKMEVEQQIVQLQRQEQAAREQRQYAEQRLKQQEQQNMVYANELRQLQQQFSNVLAAYNEYEQLAPDTKERLARIVKGDSIETFVYCGVQYDNIEPLWEMIKREIIEGRTADLAKLEAIFAFFLQAHNSIYTSPLFVRSFVEVGQTLDEDVHIRTSDSSVAGTIKQVYLAGYRNAKTNKVVKKSVVLV